MRVVGRGGKATDDAGVSARKGRDAKYSHGKFADAKPEVLVPALIFALKFAIG